MNISKCIIISSNYDNPLKIKKKEIEKIFLTNGLVILRNFNFNEDNFYAFVKQFTKTFSTDANRREKTKKKEINHVDTGYKKMSLHSEASFAPSWPEILWFFGKKISKKYGETTLCCGNELWESLNQETKKFLKSNLLKFKIKSDLKLKLKNKIWDLNKIGVFNERIDKNGFLNYEHIKFSINKNKYNQKIYLSSHILYENTDPTILSMKLINDKKIPIKFLKEIKNKSKLLTYFHKWKKNDVLMVDNKKFMHGRNKIVKNENRQILNIQTLVSNIKYYE